MGRHRHAIAVERPVASTSQRQREAISGLACLESGWRDLNPRPFDPQSNALAKLRYSPRRTEKCSGTQRVRQCAHARTPRRDHAAHLERAMPHLRAPLPVPGHPTRRRGAAREAAALPTLRAMALLPRGTDPRRGDAAKVTGDGLAAVSRFRRTGWDSNPRYGYPYTAFPMLLLQPLGHLS